MNKYYVLLILLPLFCVNQATSQVSVGKQRIFDKSQIVESNGAVSFGPNIRLTFDGASSINPRIVVDQSYAYVVWQDDRDGNWEIYWEKINKTTGEVVINPIRLTNSSITSREPAIDIDANSNSYIVWEEKDYLYGTIYAAKIDSGGNILITPMPVSSNLSTHPDISVISSGVNWITYHRMTASNQDVYLRKSNSSLLEQCVTHWNKGTIPGIQKQPSVVAIDSYVIVAWRDLLPSFQYGVFARIFNYECGNIYDYYVYGDYTNPDVTGFGNTFFVTFELGGNIYNLLDNNSVFRINDIPGVAHYPHIATNNINGLFTWQDSRNGNQDIFYTKAYTNDSYIDDPVTTDAGVSSSPDIAGYPMDPEKSWVVWQDNRDGNWEIYFANNIPPCDNFTGLFCDDFEDDVLTEWQALKGSCTWSEANGILSTSNTGQEQWCIQTVGNQNWDNYVLEAKVRGNSGVDKVLVFRVQNENNYYAVNLRSDYPSTGIDQLTFDKMVDGTYNADIVTTDYTSENGVWYQLKVACADNSFKIYVDDSLVLEYTDNDNPFYTGGIGIACWTGYYGDCDISFDDVEVTDPYPHIVYDNITGIETGQLLTIEGHLEYSDGSVYTPLIDSTIGCEDPISNMSRIVPIDSYGAFSYSPIRSTELAGPYIFNFYASNEYGIVKSILNIPIKKSIEEYEVFYDVRYEIQSGKIQLPFDKNTETVSIRPIGSSLPPLVNPLWEGFKTMSKGMLTDIATTWRKKISDPNGTFLSKVRETNFDRCDEGPIYISNCAFGGLIYVWQVINVSTWDVLITKLEEGIDIAEQAGLPHCAALGAKAGLAAGDLIPLLLSGDASTMELDEAVNAFVTSSGFALKEVEILDQSISEGCLPQETDKYFGSLLLKFLNSSGGQIYIMGLIPKISKVINIKGFSPIEITVTDPRGRVISPYINDIPGAKYFRGDFNLDGEDEISIIIPLDTIGNLLINVVPDSTALPTDSFTIIANYSYYMDPIVLADNEQIINIPTQPYQVTTFENEPPNTFSLIVPHDTAFYDSVSIPFSWETTSDPNPGHNVFYDLLIASDSLFDDTVVLYNLTDTMYLFADTLPTDTINNLFFWKVRAHDLWGASTFSDQIYSFYISPNCCVPPTRGNVDGLSGPNGSIDVADLSYLVALMWEGGEDPPCTVEGNVDGVVGPFGPIDVADLSYLVAYLFQGGPAPAPCW